MRGVAVLVVPDELHRLPVDRHRHRPGVGGHRQQVVEAVTLVWSTQKARTPCVGELALEPRHVRALGQPEASAPVAEALQVRRRPGRELEPQAGVGGDQRKQRVRGGGGPELHSLERAERADEVAPALLECPFRAGVVARGAAHLRGQLRFAALVEAGGVLGVDRRAHLAHEAHVALTRLAAHGLELVAEHGREARRSPACRRAPRAAAGTRTPTASQSHSSPNGQVPKPST